MRVSIQGFQEEKRLAAIILRHRNMSATPQNATTGWHDPHYTIKRENRDKGMLEKVGVYDFLAEPFHCDFTKKLFMGRLGNHILNAADLHASHRGFGMEDLNPLHKTWVLSRLAVEMYEMPHEYEKFSIKTWIDGVMKYFTSRSFQITGTKGEETTYGYGRSVWALIDTDSRLPQDILNINGGDIAGYAANGKPCPIKEPSRVKMTDKACHTRTINTFYSDIDVNGHVNSVKYMEHILNLFDIDWHKEYRIKRFDIAYVAESHYGDRLSFYREDASNNTTYIRITKVSPKDGKETEVCRSKIEFANT